MNQRLAHIYLMVATIFWAGNVVFGQLLIQSLGPWTISAVRWTIASLLLLPIVLRKEKQAFKKIFSQWPILVILGVTGIAAFNSLAYEALQYTTPLKITLIVSTSPVTIALFNWIYSGDKPNIKQWVGMGLTILGVVWIITEGSYATLINLALNKGDILGLIAVVIWSIYTVVGKKLMRDYSPLVVTTASVLVGTIFLYPISFFEISYRPVEVNHWMVLVGLGYIGICASVFAFMSWNNGIKVLGPAKGAVYMNLVPVFAAILGAIIGNLEITVNHLIGGISVALGVYWTAQARGISKPITETQLREIEAC